MVKHFAYYNEIDSFAAEWLRELIKAGRIMDGEVDERSIEDVLPSDVMGFTRVHTFAGLGAWDYALKLSGFPEYRPVWTGSCPCQPFSSAGKGEGTLDIRHLWPAWFHLISQCRPKRVYGEQVDAAIKHGWLDLVSDDLEGIGYVVGAASVPDCGVGAPHIRQRLWFVAGSLGDTRNARLERRVRVAGIPKQEITAMQGEATFRTGVYPCWMADSDYEQHSGSGIIGAGWRIESANSGAAYGGQPATSPTNGTWGNVDWLFCRGGKWRPVEHATFPLASGITNRVGKLRGYGNAISPQVAEQIIRATM